jgi:Fe2+ or Zn2+ uptake regulation protein
MRIVCNGNEEMNTKKKAKVLQAYNEAGLRKTKQRVLIMEIIRRERHLDADEVCRRAREKQPRLSLSTVYRTLQTLKEKGLVEEVHFDEAHHHYETKPANEHHHLVCLGCGRVIEFCYSLAHFIKEDVAEARDFEITGSEVRMTGYCPTCRRSK